MKLLLLNLILLTSLFSSDIELNLKQFTSLVSNQHNINIIIDDKLESSKFTFFLQKDKNTILLSAFKKMLSYKNLVLHFDKKNNFYYISAPIFKKILTKIYTIKLHSLNFKEFEPFLIQFPNLKYNYVLSSNVLILTCTESIYNKILRVFKTIDIIPEQFKLKITVIEINKKNLKSRGVDISAFANASSDSTSLFLNLITLPVTATTNIIDSKSINFSATLKFLNDLGVSEIKTSPTVTVQSGKLVYFSSVENIPYKTSQSSVNGASNSTTEVIKYKDIGLKVSLKPLLIDDIVFIDMNFIIENILDKSSLTPSTSKREIKNNFQLIKGEILVLSGVTQTEKSTSTYGVPILMNIPYLGKMFSFDVSNKIVKTLSILIEVL